MKILPLLAVPLLLGSCALPSETDPFRARQQWQVSGRDGETRVDAVVGTGWLGQFKSDTNSTPTPPRLAKEKYLYVNKDPIWGVMTTLLRSDTTPTLILDAEKREGLAMWNAGKPGDTYACRFTFYRGATRFGGDLLKHVQTQDVPVGTCIIELKR